jgi:hypothetical protein
MEVSPVYGHIDHDSMCIDSALNIGLCSYKHILTLVNSVLHVQHDSEEFSLEMQQYYTPGMGTANRELERLEIRFIHDKNPGR